MKRYYDIAAEFYPHAATPRPKSYWRGLIHDLARRRFTTPGGNQLPPALGAALMSPAGLPHMGDAAPPRTLHCIGSLGAGGAERQLINLITELEDRGHHRQALLTTNPLEHDHAHYLHLLEKRQVPVRATNQTISDQGVELIRANPEKLDLLFQLPEEFRSWSIDMWVEMSLDAPEVAHLWLDHVNLWGAPAALLADIPAVVLSTRNVHPGNFPYLHAPYMQQWYQWLEKCPRVHFINNSYPGADSYAEWMAVPPSRFTVVLNGVNLSHLKPASAAERHETRAELGVPLDARVVVGAFRMSEEKRPLLFVETCAKAMAVDASVHAVLMGEGPLREAAAARAAELGIADRFHVIGRRRDLPRVMSSMDVFLHTAWWEGTPNVVLEAQQLTLPVVVANGGGAADAVMHGQTGLLVEREDEPGLAASLIEVLENLDTWRERAKGGPAFVANKFGLARMVDETVAVQRAALFGHGQPSSGAPPARPMPTPVSQRALDASLNPIAR